MEYWHWYTALYVAMCKLYLFIGLRTNSKTVKVILKCFPLAILIVAVAARLINSIAPVSASAPGSVSKLSQLFWGLVFSCIGNAYLLFPNYFLFGVVSFVIAQSIYIFLFGGSFTMFQEVSQIEVMIGLAVAAVCLLMCILHMVHMEPLTAAGATVYSVLISTMLWSALIQAHRSPNDLTILGATGAVFFYTSDVILSIDKWGKTVPYGQVFIMTTYYSAQLFITGSVLGIN